MEYDIAVLVGIGGLVLASVIAFGVYKWRQRNRVNQVNKWVNDYLVNRYGLLPRHVRTNCSNDAFWPVLVGFDTPGTGIRHNLQFSCDGPPRDWFLLSESDEQRQ